MEIIKKYWKEILALIIIIDCIVGWQLFFKDNQSNISKTLNQQTQIELQKANAKLKEIEDRQKNLYPQIDSKLININNSIKDSKTKLNQIQKEQLKKDQIYEEFKKGDIYKISKYLNDNGYSNTVINH